MGKGASPFTQGVRQTWRKWKWGKPGAKVYKMFSQFDIGSHQIRLKATGFLHSASSHLDNVNDELFAKPKRSSLPKPDLEELPCCGFLYFWVSVCKRQQKWVSFGCYPAILLLATTIQIRTILLYRYHEKWHQTNQTEFGLFNWRSDEPIRFLEELKFLWKRKTGEIFWLKRVWQGPECVSAARSGAAGTFEEKKVFQLLKRSLATQWHSNVLALMFTYAYASATSRHKLLSAVSISRAVLLILIFISAALCYLFILLLTTPPISTYFHSLRLWIEKPL